MLKLETEYFGARAVVLVNVGKVTHDDEVVVALAPSTAEMYTEKPVEENGAGYAYPRTHTEKHLLPVTVALVAKTRDTYVKDMQGRLDAAVEQRREALDEVTQLKKERLALEAAREKLVQEYDTLQRYYTDVKLQLTMRTNDMRATTEQLQKLEEQVERVKRAIGEERWKAITEGA